MSILPEIPSIQKPAEQSAGFLFDADLSQLFSTFAPVKILLLSDTHGYLDGQILRHAKGCDEIWHAGDFGTDDLANQLSQTAPLRGVYGNIDGQTLRIRFPLINIFEAAGLKVMMTHIGGYPGRYAPGIKSKLKEAQPHLFISGHSHILKVMRDAELNNMLHINPGAAGREGFHPVRTLVKFTIEQGNIHSIEAIELGSRSRMS